MISYLLLDIDGVLTDPDESYSIELKNKLNSLMISGIKIHLVSSRPYAFSKPVIDWYNLDDVPHIVEGGSLIRSKENLIQESSIPGDVLHKIIQELKVDLDILPLQISTASKCFLNSRCLKRFLHLANFASPLADFSDFNGILTLGFRGLTDEQKKIIENFVVSKDLSIEEHCRDTGTWTLFIRKSRNSKFTALNKIEELGIISLKDSMFITDDTLDTAIFPYLGKSGVPINASVQAKNMANEKSDFGYTKGCLDLLRRCI